MLIEANDGAGHLDGDGQREMETIHVVPKRYPQGEYLLVYDPLTVREHHVNVSIGTIFSVLRKVGHPRASRGRLFAARPPPGAAGYASTARGRRWCYAGDGVVMFTLDRELARGC